MKAFAQAPVSPSPLEREPQCLSRVIDAGNSRGISRRNNVPAPSAAGAGGGWRPHTKHGMARFCPCFAWLSPGWAPRASSASCSQEERAERRSPGFWPSFCSPGSSPAAPPADQGSLRRSRPLPPLAFLLSLSLLRSLPRLPLLNLVPQNLQQSGAEHQASFALPSPSNRKARRRLPTQKGAYFHGLCRGCGLGPRARTLQRQGNISLEVRLVLHHVSYMLFFPHTVNTHEL